MARKLRIECEQRTRAGGVLKCLRTGVQPLFYRGEAIILELGLFANGRMVLRSDLTNIKVRFKNGATLLTETIIVSANLSASLTAQQWRQGNGALASINYGTAATGDLPAGMLTLEVVGTLAAGGESIFCSGTLESATLAGLTTGTPPTPTPPTAYTKAESDALYDPLGSSSGLADDITAIQAFVEHSGETSSGGFVRAVDQSFTTTEQKTVRQNIYAPIYSGTHTITGEQGYPFDVETGLNSNTIQTTANGQKGTLTVVTPAANTEIDFRAPAIPVGVSHMLKIKQGYVVNWTSAFTFPPYEITNAAGTGDFAKKSWHPNNGEGYDRFTLVNDGTTTHVRRFNKANLPIPTIDFTSESPGWPGGASTWTDLYGSTAATVAGTPATTALAGSSFVGVAYNGTSNSHNWTMGAAVVAQGMTIAMVFSATASTGQKILFASNSMGIQVVADTDGMRLQSFGGGSGTGLLISSSYSAAPVAFVAVVRPASLGAFVLTTSATGGNTTTSFNPTTPTAGYARFASESGGYTKGLACTIARCQIFRTGLSVEAAQAVLDSLTSHYKLG